MNKLLLIALVLFVPFALCQTDTLILDTATETNVETFVETETFQETASDTVATTVPVETVTETVDITETPPPVIPEGCVLVVPTGICSDLGLTNLTTDPEFLGLLPKFENIYAQEWEEWENLLREGFDQQSGTDDIEICDDCLQMIRYLQCAAHVPNCGYAECLRTEHALAETCLNDCFEDQCSEDTNSNECKDCANDCYEDNVLSVCRNFLMSRETCSRLVSVCACTDDSNVVNNVCENFFEEGFTRDDIPEDLSCDNVNGWCSNDNDFPEVIGSKIFCPNELVCLIAPQTVGSAVVASPFIVIRTEDGVRNIQNSAASISPILVPFMVALFALKSLF